MRLFVDLTAHDFGRIIPRQRRLRTLVAVQILFWSFTPGCSSIMLPSLVEPMVNGLRYQDDLQLACEGAPAYLLMLDSLLVADPGNETLLLKAAQAYAAYADVSVECGDPGHSAVLSEKAKKYGVALLSLDRELAKALDGPLPGLVQALSRFRRDEVETLFWGGFAWAGWIRSQHGSPAALIDLAKVEKIMQRILELDEGYYDGGAHLFLGYYYGSRPPMYGGNPEASAFHFQKALAISRREFLAVQVGYAETYAQLAFNRELYEELLKEVLEFPLARAPEHTLSNQLAKLRAKRLLEEIDNRF